MILQVYTKYTIMHHIVFSTPLQLAGSLWSEYRHWLTCLSPHLCPVLALAVDPVTENIFFITREEEEDDEVSYQ